MAFNARMTVFFADPTLNVGWTETWILNAVDYPSAYATFGSFAPLRVALMMDTSFITTVRISNVNAIRDSFVRSIPAAIGQGTISHATVPPAGLDDALIWRKDDGVTYTYFNKLFMHSVPAGIFNGRIYPATTPPAGWTAAVIAFQTFILAGANGFLVRKGGPPVTYVPIGSFDPLRRTTRKLGRPFGLLVGRRAIA